MALSKYEKDTAVLVKVGLDPEDRTDLNDDTFRAKWDENATDWKTFFNDTASVELDALITAIKGAGWTSESLKGLADLISTKVNPNAIINGCFRVNQRVKTGTVTLSAGQYGHDRWKAGASGCTYTFATSGGVTIITIAAGSLIQVVEGSNLETATYCLSWIGTAQGKIGAGSLSVSGVTGSVTGGSDLSIEFGTGTLSKVKLELGSLPTPFVFRPLAEELRICQRYYEKSIAQGVSPGGGVSAGWINYQTRTALAASTAATLYFGATFKSTKRTAPTVTLYDANNGTANAVRCANSGNVRTGCTAGGIEDNGFAYISVSNVSTQVASLDEPIQFHYVADAEI